MTIFNTAATDIVRARVRGLNPGPVTILGTLDPPRHSDKEKQRESNKHKGARVEEPEMRKEKVEKEPTKLHRNADEKSEPLPKGKMEEVGEEVDGLPP